GPPWAQSTARHMPLRPVGRSPLASVQARPPFVVCETRPAIVASSGMYASSGLAGLTSISLMPPGGRPAVRFSHVTPLVVRYSRPMLVPAQMVLGAPGATVSARSTPSLAVRSPLSESQLAPSFIERHTR